MPGEPISSRTVTLCSRSRIGSTATRISGGASRSSTKSTIRSGWPRAAAFCFLASMRRRRSVKGTRMPQPYHLWPDVEIDGSPLPDAMEGLLEQVVVDHHQHLPGMFAITFHD